MRVSSKITKIVHWMIDNDTRAYITLTCLNICILTSIFACVVGTLIIRYPPVPIRLDLAPASKTATRTLAPLKTPTKTHPKITRSLTPTPYQPTNPPTETSTPTIIPTETLTPSPTIPVSIIDPNNNQYTPGQTAKLTIKTIPNTECTLKYITPMGNESQAQNLGKITSDQNGICIWEWMIGTNTNPGTGRLLVTITGYGTAQYDIFIIEGIQ